MKESELLKIRAGVRWREEGEKSTSYFLSRFKARVEEAVMHSIRVGKNLTLVGNWRPFSLSACDLKIITKAYDNRLNVLLPSIMHESQAAYIPGRDISFNNRLLQHAKSYATKLSLDFFIVSLDAQKAFDWADHRFLAKLLEQKGRFSKRPSK